MKTRWPSLLCLLSCILSGAAAFSTAAERQSNTPPASAYQRYQGFTHPSRELMVESYIDGVLQTLHVKAGDRFKKGEILVSMDARIQVLAVEVARIQSESTARIEAAKASVEEAQAELDSQDKLAETGSATPREIRKAKARLAVTKAEYALAKENQGLAVKQYEIERQRLELYAFNATFAGEVVAVATAEGAEEGAALRQNDPIMHLAQLDPLIARISLPEEVVDQLKVGSDYPLGVGSRDKPAKARLKRIASVADRGSQLIEIEFEISNPGNAIRSGVRCQLLDLEPSEDKAAKP